MLVSKKIGALRLLFFVCKLLIGLGKLVGTTGFEPVTTTPPVWCATRLRYAPKSTAH
jgi:hypothetical protein